METYRGLKYACMVVDYDRGPERELHALVECGDGRPDIELDVGQPFTGTLEEAFAELQRRAHAKIDALITAGELSAA